MPFMEPSGVCCWGKIGVESSAWGLNWMKLKPQCSWRSHGVQQVTLGGQVTCAIDGMNQVIAGAVASTCFGNSKAWKRDRAFP